MIHKLKISFRETHRTEKEDHDQYRENEPNIRLVCHEPRGQNRVGRCLVPRLLQHVESALVELLLLFLAHHLVFFNHGRQFFLYVLR